MLHCDGMNVFGENISVFFKKVKLTLIAEITNLRLKNLNRLNSETKHQKQNLKFKTYLFTSYIYFRLLLIVFFIYTDYDVVLSY